jgi:competence protein CoiA
MLSARRKSDGQTVTAYFERKSNGPFLCLQCNEEVILKSGRNRVDHFAHANPRACKFAEGESDLHRRCKLEIFEALQKSAGVRDIALERPMGRNRPDVSARINGVPVAIEVQISALSIETLMQRTIDYFRKGIYVLWLLQWTPALDAARYTPKLWEKWIHAAYFGRVYYWTGGLTVVSYTFEPYLRSIRKKTWYSARGKKVTGGGYTLRSKRHRTAVRGETATKTNVKLAWRFKCMSEITTMYIRCILLGPLLEANKPVHLCHRSAMVERLRKRTGLSTGM